MAPGSRCPSCGAAVAAYDNVPVLSWLLLRGRCRSCGTRISTRYPLIELGTALTFVLIAIVRGIDAGLIWQLPFAAVLLAVAIIDLERHIIPNRIIAPAAVYAVVVGALLRTDHLPSLLIAGAAAFALLLLAALAYPGGMGMGDVKLAGLMGLFLGPSAAPALLTAFLAGSLVGVGMIVRGGAGVRKRGLPFGPFLSLGGLVGVLAGPELLDLYEGAFLS